MVLKCEYPCEKGRQLLLINCCYLIQLLQIFIYFISLGNFAPKLSLGDCRTLILCELIQTTGAPNVTYRDVIIDYNSIVHVVLLQNHKLLSTYN